MMAKLVQRDLFQPMLFDRNNLWSLAKGTLPGEIVTRHFGGWNCRSPVLVASLLALNLPADRFASLAGLEGTFRAEVVKILLDNGVAVA